MSLVCKEQTKIGSSVEVERAQARAHGLKGTLIAHEEQSFSQGMTTPSSFLGKPRLQDENDQFLSSSYFENFGLS